MLNGIFPASWSGSLLSALRIMTGLLVLQHGLSKFFGWPAAAPGESLGALMIIAAILETIGALLIIAGIFTRVTAFVLAGFMAAAYFMAHAPQGFFPIQNQGELAIMYCFVFLFLAAAGGGTYSVDASRGQA
jgi:putative oxidoreductase